MIVDPSAVVVNSQSDEDGILAQRVQMSAGSYRRADRLLETLGIEVVPVSVEQARLAGEAYRVYGRGSGHPAGLNFGDTFAYALAVSGNEPPLCVGHDFSATDVLVAK